MNTFKMRAGHRQVRTASMVVAMVAWLAVAPCRAEVDHSVTEKDFLADMPIVLTVSRLPQRLDETPGAVTILDRDMIRRSGVRDVADLLRLVPGFQTSNAFESTAPLASYHGAFDSFSNRIELLIDGRSAYSPYFIGSIGPGLQSVALQDIERIEVLRGSNSAAYGARAILGVINIVTRHSVDTVGQAVAVTAGSNGIRDAYAHLGWGDERGTFRLSADTRGDDGLDGAFGRDRVKRVNLRADLNPSARDEVQVRLGSMGIAAGKGLAGNLNNPPRDTFLGTDFAQLDWRRTLAGDQELTVRLSHTEEKYLDSFDYNLRPLGIPSVYTVSVDGTTSSDALSVQHSFRPGASLRLVWGGEFRSEHVTSRGFYNTDAAFVTDFSRLFGNLEWRAAPAWVLNLGAMAEQSSVTGSSLAPRAMLNWHAAPGQTWRLGVSKAFRPPSTYEKFADVRFIWNGRLLDVNTVASGRVDPESLLSTELGYLGEFPRWGLGLDARLFHEQIKGFIRQQNTRLPRDYANDEDFAIHGLEYQLTWRLGTESRLVLNQAYMRNDSHRIGRDTAQATPELASSLSYFRTLPGNLELSLIHQDSRAFTLQGAGDAFAVRRTDVRLARPLRWGVKSGELALVVQNLGGTYPDFNQKFGFQRRAFVTLSLEQ